VREVRERDIRETVTTSRYYRTAAHPHPHLRWVWPPQLVTELSPPGEVVAASQAPNASAHRGDKSPQCVVVGEVPGVWPWGRYQRLWLWGMITHNLALLR